MSAIFKEGYRITQLYGENPEYYQRFGIPHHEGIDICPPLTGRDWTVYPLYPGIVVRDIDDERSGGAYGVYVTVWHPDLQLATRYCHLENNLVQKGQKVGIYDALGKMGNTGNSGGAHVHFEVIAVDANGMRQGKYGIYGRVDPFPLLLHHGGRPELINGEAWEAWAEVNPEWRGRNV